MQKDGATTGRLGTKRRIAGMFIGGVLMCLSATGLGGCNNELKDKNAALTQENQELRDRNTQLEQSLASADTGKTANGDMGYDDSSPSPRKSSSSGRGTDWGGARVSSRGNDVVVAVAGDVLFDSGRTTLKPAAKQTLDKVAANLKKQYNGHRVRIEGYTDTDPIKKSKFASNEALSKERAEVVQNYLISKGVNRSLVTTVGMGSANPKSTKKDSRRVEIVILDNG